MKTRVSAKGEFGKALLTSLLAHLIVAALVVGLGTVMPVKKQETQVEWAWTAPGQTATPQPGSSSVASFPPVRGEPSSSRPTAGSSEATPDAVPSAGSSEGGAVYGAAAGSATVAGPTVEPGSAAGPATLPTGFRGSSVSSGRGQLVPQPKGDGLAIIPPRIRERPPLQLPAALSQAGLSGEVLLLVEVWEDGRVGKISMERSSGNKALDELARDNVLRWKFDPAWQPQGNKTVRVLTAVWVKFGKNRSEQQ